MEGEEKKRVYEQARSIVMYLARAHKSVTDIHFEAKFGIVTPSSSPSILFSWLRWEHLRTFITKAPGLLTLGG